MKSFVASLVFVAMTAEAKWFWQHDDPQVQPVVPVKPTV